MATTAERLRQALALRGMRQSELAERTKIGKSSISTYLTGAYLPKQRNIYKMAAVLNVNKAWLMGLDVPMERQDTQAAPPSPIPPGFEPMPEIVKVPLIGSIACGQPITAEENLEGYVDAPGIVHCDFALRCEGDSMIDAGISEGDVVFIRKQPDVPNGQIAAVRIGDNS